VAAAGSHKRQALERPTGDPDPKALACSGLLGRGQPRAPEQLRRRCVADRPVSAVTTALLAWGHERLAAQGVTALVWIWENAAWPQSQVVRGWRRHHTQTVNHPGQGVRIVPYLLPVKSPWLNPIEPKGVQGKRAIAESDQRRSAAALEARVYAYDGGPPESPLMMPKKVA
jgi:hypothetical protein